MKSSNPMFPYLALFLSKVFILISTGWVNACCMQETQEEYGEILKKSIDRITRNLENNPNDASLLKMRGDFFEAIGKYSEAILDYSKLINLNPDDAEAYHARGSIYHRHLDKPELARSDFKNELKIYDKKIGLNFDDVDSYSSRAFVNFWYFKNNEKAIEDYAMVLLFQPNNIHARLQRSKLYKEIGRVGESLGDIDLIISHYSDLISKDATDKESINGRARIFVEIKRYQDALMDYTSLIKLEPEEKNHYESRAKVYGLLEKPLDAISDYTSLLKIDPNDSNCYQCRAELFIKLKKYPEALADLNMGIKLRPGDAFNYMHRGDVHKAMGAKLPSIADYLKTHALDPENYPLDRFVKVEDLSTPEERDFYNLKVLEIYTNAIAAEPKNISRYKTRAEFYALDVRTYSRAVEDYTKILEIAPGDEDAVNEKLRLLLELKRLPEVVLFLDKILVMDPENEEFFKKRNDCLIELKRYPELFVHLASKINKEYDQEKYFSVRANIYMEIADFHKARDDYKALLKIHDARIAEEPENPSLYFARAKFLEKHFRNHELALADFTKAVSLDPKNFQYLEARAKLYQASCNHNAAIKDYNRLIQENPGKVEYLGSRAWIHSSIWDFPSAIRDYDLILQQKPDDLNAYEERGLLFLYMNKPDLAKADFLKVLEFHNATIAKTPKDIRAYESRMRFLIIYMKAYEEATKDYLKIKELDASKNIGYYGEVLKKRSPKLTKKILDSKPQNSDEFYCRAEAFFNSKRYSDALSDYGKVLEFDPDHDYALNSMADLLDKIGDKQKAKEKYLKILAKVDAKIKQLDDEIYCEKYGDASYDSDASLYCERASLYQKLDRVPEAFSELTKVTKFAPKYSYAYAQRGELYMEVGRFNEAVEDFTKALKLMPMLSYVSYNRARALMKLNKYQEALEDFNRAISVVEHHSNCGEWYENRSFAYRALGKIKEADADLAKANQLLLNK